MCNMNLISTFYVDRMSHINLPAMQLAMWLKVIISIHSTFFICVAIVATHT